MKLIVGLGNPGWEYQFTPHNLGFMTIDALAHEWGVEVRNRQARARTAQVLFAEQSLLLVKPETYMNLSGTSIMELVAHYEVQPACGLIVIYDELDLPLGTIRIRQRGGSAGHNGMKSIIRTLGTEEFLRIRMGIHPVRQILKPFSHAQLKGVVGEMLDKACEAVRVILQQGPAAAMNLFNRKPESGDQQD